MYPAVPPARTKTTPAKRIAILLPSTLEDSRTPNTCTLPAAGSFSRLPPAADALLRRHSALPEPGHLSSGTAHPSQCAKHGRAAQSQYIWPAGEETSVGTMTNESQQTRGLFHPNQPHLPTRTGNHSCRVTSAWPENDSTEAKSSACLPHPRRSCNSHLPSSALSSLPPIPGPGHVRGTGEYS